MALYSLENGNHKQQEILNAGDSRSIMLLLLLDYYFFKRSIEQSLKSFRFVSLSLNIKKTMPSSITLHDGGRMV